MDNASIGKRIKQLYPAYANYSDEVVGQRFILKYGDKAYTSLGLTPPTKTPEPNNPTHEQSQLENQLAQDIVKGSTFSDLYKSYVEPGDLPFALVRGQYNAGPVAKQYGPAKETVADFEKAKEDKKVTDTAQQKADSADVAMGDVNQMDNILQSREGKKAKNLWKAGPVITMFAGGATQVYRNSAKNAYDTIMRTRTGAALNKDEETFYKEYIPSWEDTPDSVKDKMNRLKKIFQKAIDAGDFEPENLLSPLSSSSPLIDYLNGGGGASTFIAD